MRNAIIIMLLAFFNSNAMAGWLEASISSIGTSYMDPSNLNRDGNIVKVAILIDLKSDLMFEGKAYLSLIQHDEFDCEKRQIRELSSVAYSLNMGKGEVVYSSPESGVWNPAIPKFETGKLWHRACDNHQLAF